MPSESVVGVNDLGDSPSTASYTNKQHKLAIDQGPLYVFLAFDKVYPPGPLYVFLAFDKVWASTSVWMSTMRIICNMTPLDSGRLVTTNRNLSIDLEKTRVRFREI